MKASNVGVGFDDKFFQLFKKKIEILDHELAKKGMICFDEMQIRKALDVNIKDMTFNGLVDFGNHKKPAENSCVDQDSPTAKKKSKKSEDMSGKLADHALVFMFSSISVRFNQPIGFFLCKGSSDSNTLFSLLITAIIKTEEAGAQVHAIVCDGAQSNRGIWKDLGVSAKPNNEGRCWFENPFDTTSKENEIRKIYVLSDAPHLIKCVRNRFYNNKESMEQYKNI